MLNRIKDCIKRKHLTVLWFWSMILITWPVIRVVFLCPAWIYFSQFYFLLKKKYDMKNRLCTFPVYDPEVPRYKSTGITCMAIHSCIRYVQIRQIIIRNHWAVHERFTRRSFQILRVIFYLAVLLNLTCQLPNPVLFVLSIYCNRNRLNYWYTKIVKFYESIIILLHVNKHEKNCWQIADKCVNSSGK